MYPGRAELWIGILNLIGLLILGFIVFRERNFIRQLFPKNEARDVRNKFKEVLGVIDDFARQNHQLNKNFRGLVKMGLSHTQKVSVLRYNPYQDTGGDQSFSVALLDGNSDGIILTSLHSRSGTRVYIKSVDKGKSEVELSKEEKEVLGKAVSKI